MLTRTAIRRAFTAGQLNGSGIYDEDFTNEYKIQHIKHNNRLKAIYAKNEFNTVAKVLDHHQRNDSFAQHAGRDPRNGYGAFEREMERKGIPVDKYPLPNTVQATRVREMTLLRRTKLEERSAEVMGQHRAERRRATPSEWYDETNGPLNPHYLKFVKNQYSGMDVTQLPNKPIRHDTHLKRVKAAAEASAAGATAGQ